MNKNKGFTLIELLVVIAVIGVLASVVLASLNSARNKNADAAIKTGLNQARTEAELYYISNNGSYTNVCAVASDTATPKGINAMVLSAAKASGLTSVAVNATGTMTTATCNVNGAGTSWAAEVPLETPATASVYCVDSTRKGVVKTTSIGGNTLCP
ncbi:MAG: type II secretion system protein [Candidatus Paceibacterota bacterium]|jgi:prepilin-type N-terminal cleavage/methylation domain-containing protein